MRDVMNRNPMVVTGTPALVPGLLTVDQNQALQWNGTTNSAQAVDSPSLSYTGSMSMSLLIRVLAYPGSTKLIFGKVGSYELSIDTTGHLIWKLTGGGTVTVTSPTALALNTTYHIVCVYNGNYAGVTRFGQAVQGATTLGLFSDYFNGVAQSSANNLIVGKFTMPERGILTSIVADIDLGHDQTVHQWLTAVAYLDNAGSPGAKVAQSADAHNFTPTATLLDRNWVTYGASGLLAPADYWLGLVGGSAAGGSLSVGQNAAGGHRAWRHADVTETSGFTLANQTPDPFGAAVITDTGELAIYANYDAVGRSGDEGKALLYLNGVLNASSAYTLGITDNAAALQVAPSYAIVTDERLVFPFALSKVQVAQLFTAH